MAASLSAQAGSDADAAGPDAREWHLVLFSSVELGGRSSALTNGFKRDPGREGWAVMALSSLGSYRLEGGSTRSARTRVTGGAGLLLGYAWDPGFLGHHDGTLLLMAGPRAEWALEYGGDEPARLEPTRWGAQILAEYRGRPAPGSQIVATLAVDTLHPGFWGRLAYGWDVLDFVSLGPEAVLSWYPDWVQGRLGAHVSSGALIWDLGLRLSAGLSLGPDCSPGLYATLTTHWRF